MSRSQDTTPVRRYDQLGDGDRKLRKVSDAVALLRKRAGLRDHDRARIEIGLLVPPSGETAGLVAVLFDAPWQEKGYCVWLRTAPRFKGRRQGARQFEVFDIVRLNSAVVDCSGTVTLADGIMLEAVEMLSAPMLTEPSDLDWRILHAALTVIKDGERCYKSFRDHVPPGLREMVPNRLILDCARLKGLQIPPLKVLAIDVAQTDAELKNISQQKIADALRKFGLRVPSPRPRVKAKHKG